MQAILWQNGMLMVFDDAGEQLPKYQGKANEMIPKLKTDFPDVVIEERKWV